MLRTFLDSTVLDCTTAIPRAQIADSDCQTCRVAIEDDGDRKVDPRSLACAVKGVYASLWNKRAVDEPSFARIDQATVAMGLAIVAANDSDADVVANAVVVTRVLNTDAVYGYSLSVQAGNNLVTNPELSGPLFRSDGRHHEAEVTRS